MDRTEPKTRKLPRLAALPPCRLAALPPCRLAALPPCRLATTVAMMVAPASGIAAPVKFGGGRWLLVEAIYK